MGLSIILYFSNDLTKYACIMQNWKVLKCKKIDLELHLLEITIINILMYFKAWTNNWKFWFSIMLFLLKYYHKTFSSH